MIYCFGDCALDTQLFTVRRAGQTHRMRPKVFHVLSYLIAHRDRVVEKHELAEQVWPDHFISDATLESTIRAARRTLGDNGREQRLIETLYGQGYRFVAQIDQVIDTGTTAPQPTSDDVQSSTRQEVGSAEEVGSDTPIPGETAPADAWHCSACQHVNPMHQMDASRFCMACGTPRQKPCPQCGVDTPSEARFCAACGASLAGTPAPPVVTLSPASGAVPLAVTASDAERRHLTVLVCEVADSSALSSRMELEAYLAIIREYQRTCAVVLARLEGHIA